MFDELIMHEPPAVQERPDVYSRIFSDNADDGLHVTFTGRRRGSTESETTTVVIPPSMIEDLIRLLRDSQPTT